MALLLTLISGLFFLLGIIVYRLTKHKNTVASMSMGCALVVIVGLIFGDLLPELLEFGKWWIFIFVVLGLVILVLIDKLIPHHHHDHKEHDEETKEHQGHLEHIGTITLIALLLHNMIEGMALYSVTLNDLKSGVLMMVGIGLHNIPFGFQIANYTQNKKNYFLLTLLILSGFIGGLLFSLCGGINPFIEAIIIALTMGMLLQILLFELLPEVSRNIKKKETIYGIIIGVVLILIIHVI